MKVSLYIFLFYLLLARKKCNRCGKKAKCFYQEGESLSSTNLSSVEINDLDPSNNPIQIQGRISNFNPKYNLNIYDKNDNNIEIKSNMNQVEGQIEDNDKNKLNKRNKKPLIERKGDWICLRCHNLNFSFRTHCNRCHFRKNENTLLMKTQQKEK